MSARERFVGAWRLVAVRDLLAGGSSAPSRFGVAPRGLIVYTADGFVSVNFMRPGRAPWNDEEGPAPDVASASALGYGAYAGRWQLDEARGLVRHHVEVALIPDRVGTTLVRAYVLAGDRLTLRPVAPAGAALHPRALVWERVRGAV